METNGSDERKLKVGDIVYMCNPEWILEHQDCDDLRNLTEARVISGLRWLEGGDPPNGLFASIPLSVESKIDGHARELSIAGPLYLIDQDEVGLSYFWTPEEAVTEAIRELREAAQRATALLEAGAASLDSRPAAG